MKRGRDPSEPDLETQLREAFTAADPEAAWYFDRGLERVVRVAHGVTNIPDLAADEVEGDESRYVEIPAVLDSELHDWIERFVEERADPAVTAFLDEKQGANARFLKRLAEVAPAFADWKAFYDARVAESVAAWRDGI